MTENGGATAHVGWTIVVLTMHLAEHNHLTIAFDSKFTQ